jgi:hypothetical protein
MNPPFSSFSDGIGSSMLKSHLLRCPNDGITEQGQNTHRCDERALGKTWKRPEEQRQRLIGTSNNSSASRMAQRADHSARLGAIRFLSRCLAQNVNFDTLVGFEWAILVVQTAGNSVYRHMSARGPHTDISCPSYHYVSRRNQIEYPNECVCCRINSLMSWPSRWWNQEHLWLGL